MSRRIVIVEPDVSGRSMMDRVLAAEGFAPVAVGSAHDAQALLDGGEVELSIIDELAGRGAVLEELRWLRRNYPKLPVIAIGTLLSQRVMQELLRLGVVDALVKPFTPKELRDAVTRAFAQLGAGRIEALTYDATVGTARAAILEGRLAEAKAALARAQGIAPFDAEIMALLALVAELGGRDDDADHGYRAALALRQHEDGAPPDPHEGLARLAAYRGAAPVRALRPERVGAPIRIVADPARDLGPDLPRGPAAPVILCGLGLGSAAPGAIFLRDGEGTPAFALMSGALRVESIVAALARLGDGPLLVGEPGSAGIDLARIDALRRGSSP